MRQPQKIQFAGWVLLSLVWGFFWVCGFFCLVCLGFVFNKCHLTLVHWTADIGTTTTKKSSPLKVLFRKSLLKLDTNLMKTSLRPATTDRITWNLMLKNTKQTDTKPQKMFPKAKSKKAFHTATWWREQTDEKDSTFPSPFILWLWFHQTI